MDKTKARYWGPNTLNNPEMTVEEYFHKWMLSGKVRYISGQTEIGKDGTPHIQFVMTMKELVRLSALKKICPRAHFEPTLYKDAADEYCKKTETG